MGEHLWHRVSEHGQPPEILPTQVLLYRCISGQTLQSSTVRCRLHDCGTDEWCVVDLPTEYAPAPLRNGWMPIETCPLKERVLGWYPDAGPFDMFHGQPCDRTASQAVAWMPLPAGPYDEGAPE